MKPVMHYWGAEAIVVRLGWQPSTGRHLLELRRRHGIPCWKRKMPSHPRLTYYASEAMLLSWELSNAKLDFERLIARDAQRPTRELRCDASRVLAKRSSGNGESEA